MTPTVAPETLGFDPVRLERIRAWAAEYLEHGNLPCAITLVARKGEIVFTDCQGHADTDAGSPASFDTRFRIFSMTKPVTAVAAMMLVEEARLRLDDPVSRYIPAFADVEVLADGATDITDTVALETPVTIHHLLTHTSGLTYGFFDPDSPLAGVYQRLDIDMNPNGSNSEQWAQNLASIPLMFQPGARWNYSVATDLLGRVIEVIEGKLLGEVFRERIFEPLGMTRTGFAVPIDAAGELATLYKTTTRGGLSIMDTSTESAWLEPATRHHGGGGLTSVCADYFRFAEMLRRGGELDGVRLLAPRTVKLMTTNQFSGDLASMGQPKFGESNFNGIGFGLGMAVVLDPAIAHLMTSAGEYFWGGAASTVFWIDPTQDLSVIFLTQLYPSSTYPLREELRALVNQAIVNA